MSKKKKVDLSTELADLIMGDDEHENSLPETTGPTRVVSNTEVLDKTANVEKDVDPDPTMAIAKTGATLDPSKPSIEEPLLELELSDEKKDASAVSELSKFFSRTSSAHEPTKVQSLSTMRSPNRSGAELILTAQASLVQSDQLRIAQERILELEKIVESLRAENEELVAAGETLKNRSDDLKAQLERVQLGTKEKSDVFNEELVVLRTSMHAKNEECVRAKLKIEELESRLSGDLKKIRVRERELENRLELIKLESQAVIKNKDEIVLDLKRKIDQLNYELENYRSKGKELNHVLDDNRERVRRTVKALRLALSMLEGEDQEVNPLKKAE